MNKKFIWYLIGIVVVVLVFVLLVVSAQIGYGVQQRCKAAQAQYNGDCVEALMNQVADETKTSGKNDAIWALGQLGDRRALSFLQQYDTGETLPERESWEEGISQYELRKAIRLLETGWNVPAIFWRH